jgi:hypothetical protein
MYSSLCLVGITMLVLSIIDPSRLPHPLQRTACRTKLQDPVLERRDLPMTADEKSLGSSTREHRRMSPSRRRIPDFWRVRKVRSVTG